MDKRILYVQFTNPGGYPPLEHSARILADAGWTVLCLGTGSLGSDALEFRAHPRIEVRRLRFVPGGWRQKVNFFRYLSWVVAWALAWRPTWVYASDPLATPAAIVLSVLPKVRVAYHEHDSPAADAQTMFGRLILTARRILASRARLLILPDHNRAKLFESELRPPGNVICVWNCPTRDEIASHKAPNASGDLWVHYHGSISPGHLPIAVVQALALVADRVKLRVIGYETVGNRGYTAELRRAAEMYRVADRVEFLGPMPRHVTLAHCRLGDVGLVVMPKDSPNVNEQNMVGASNKAFDYMASGLALLVSDLPDWQAQFADEGYALVCDPASEESIARAVRWFDEHREEMRDMGLRGLRKVRDQWNYETQFAPVMEVLSA